MYRNNIEEIKFEDLLNKTLTKFEINQDKSVIYISDLEGNEYEMYHDQDCCESVYIDDINGNIEDIINNPIILAEESTSRDYQSWETKPEYQYGTFLWTFYKLATVKGYLDIRWYGESNGYYSESVSLYKIIK